MSQITIPDAAAGDARRRPVASRGRLSWRQSARVQGYITYWGALLLVVAGAVLIMIPFLWMLSVSLKDDIQLYRVPAVWLPDPLAWSNYHIVMTEIPFFGLLRNTLMMTAGRVLGTVISGSFVAYGFSRFRAPGRNTLFMIVLATLILPFQVTLIPQFLLFRQLGWTDSFKPLIIPWWFGGTAFDIFLLRQFFMTVPLDYDDAARIDGANRFQILTRILMPLSAPALATIAIFTIRDAWRDFIGPLVYLKSMLQSTLSLGLFFFKDAYQPEWNRLMAMSVLVMIPLVLLFFFAQRLFIQGVVVSGVKG